MGTRIPAASHHQKNSNYKFPVGTQFFVGKTILKEKDHQGTNYPKKG